MLRLSWASRLRAEERVLWELIFSQQEKNFDGSVAKEEARAWIFQIFFFFPEIMFSSGFLAFGLTYLNVFFWLSILKVKLDWYVLEDLNLVWIDILDKFSFKLKLNQLNAIFQF